MKFLIATKSQIDLRSVLSGYRDDCHTMGNIWIVETASTAEQVYQSIEGVLPPGEPVIIAPLSMPWKLFGTTEIDDCFEH